MAKNTATDKAADTTAPFTTTLDDLFAGMTDAEKAELLAATGQANTAGGDKVPSLKVNYCDLPDKDGNEIKKGNFVFGQNPKEIQNGDDIVVEYIGLDLGKNPSITVLTYGQQYSFYSDDKNKRCNSQLVLEMGEKPVGNNLGFECRSGQCPHRADGVDSKDKCSCQWVIFCEVETPEGPQKAIMYLKGKSFMPFSDYLKAAGTLPVCFFPTKLSNKMEKQGSVTYWVTTPTLDKENPYPQAKRLENATAAKEARKGAQEFKVQQLAQKSAPRQAQIADKSEGRFAREIANDNVDDIEFE